MPRYHALRISCDAAYPGIVDDVDSTIRLVHPSRPVFRFRAPGVVVVQSHWKHWPCLFPQHGPGRKHERPIVLEDWQERIVAEHAADFLRGLFHSDGSRVRNWASFPGQPVDRRARRAPTARGPGGRWLGLAPRSEERAEGWFPAAGAPRRRGARGERATAGMWPGGSAQRWSRR